MTHWWERSPPSNVARVQFPDPASHVCWVCSWFSSLLWGFFSVFSGFPPSTENDTPMKFQFDPCVTSIKYFIYSVSLNEGRGKKSESPMEVKPMILRTPRRLDVPDQLYVHHLKNLLLECSLALRFCGRSFTHKRAENEISKSVMFQTLNNRPFYSCVLSYLAFECKRGWSWPCFDTDLSALHSNVS